jgi:hypothetical protein
MTSTRIYAPDGERGHAGTDLAATPPTLSGCRVVALDNGKPGAATLLAQLGDQLATRTGAKFLGVERKGSAATPCEDELFDSIVATADVVLTGTAD